MNIYYDPKYNTDVTIKMSFIQLQDLRYMLTIAFDQLLDDKLLCSETTHMKTYCDERCQMNLDLRELISEVNANHNRYMDEQERRYE